MRAFVIALSLLAAGAARAQSAGPYAPYPPGNGPSQPIYIPEPGHPADVPPSGEPALPPAWNDGTGGGGYAAPPAYPTQPYAAPPPGDEQPEITPAADARALLAPQNAVRATVGEPPLRWSEQLAGVAQQWADHLLATGQFAHRVGDRYGENLYEMTGGSATPQQVVAAWADEAQDYDLRTNACSGVCGHYTQIVWRTTRAVGCAVASGANRQVWVCEYDPPGNWVGYRPF